MTDDDMLRDWLSSPGKIMRWRERDPVADAVKVARELLNVQPGGLVVYNSETSLRLARAAVDMLNGERVLVTVEDAPRVRAVVAALNG